MAANPPTPEAQLQFLSKLQRVFAEGDFAATYKFALLIALADLAVELGADDGEELILTTRQIGLRFISLYWKHSLPYGNGRPDSAAGILSQNNGTQAAVVSAITGFREQTNVPTFLAATLHPGFNSLLSSVAATVSAQPLSYLQNFGGGTDEFIYERAGAGKVRLKPGMGYCLRRFYSLVQQLARAHWVGHIKGNRRNVAILGEADDLEEFLFATSRQSLELMGAGLRKLDGARCFYCGHSLNAADVDHYIPFAQYPRDLAHNFVLAHPGCNRSKSDTLAALPHLERWLERLQAKSDALAEIGTAAGFLTDSRVARQVGAWAYSNAVASGGQAWLATNDYHPIDQRYADYFHSVVGL
ncbi:HNH endonuclease [Noviherbaspirillum sp. UKPF54]|uniref:HNH endonuclease n=1 Tax=Noviherbaspirillum sp. UKPF54 TaxID=2601898 RepID=UPI0011B116FB|nr:HNH endonuclease domain-containing protein [Noviherbaspirillum sp. UKPF54]QDZ26568.1 HNH endonuclease [Noviherbaspirillum sp. UKPF54]